MNDLLKFIESSKPGVNLEYIKETEQQLGIQFPKQYIDLLCLTNKPEINGWQFYPIKDPTNLRKTFDDVIKANENEIYKFEFVFIAGDGTGNQLCFKNQNSKLLDEVYVWDHETNELTYLAKKLRDFIIN